MTGLDDLREWFIGQGWRIAPDSLRHEQNLCDWHAYKPSKLPARECECNDGKPAQLVARPWTFNPPNSREAWSSVAVSVCGEANATWFKLEAYSLKPDEVREKLPQIEVSLIAAWNALTEKA